ncbi:MAG: hypothetical protein HC880_14675 [Bacteroidia bacterium]|nr:hypothetical protein [Bacteroidia bacterium]
MMLVGDLIAGQSASIPREQVKAMWASFNQNIQRPLQEAGIPIGVGLGNHDADPNVPIDREEAEIYWKNNAPALNYVDSTHFPFYHAFTAVDGQLFCIALDGVNATNTNDDVLAWVETMLQTPEAQNASLRFIFSHLPLFRLQQPLQRPRRHSTEKLRIAGALPTVQGADLCRCAPRCLLSRSPPGH